jgi:hypothetical protein
VKSPPEASRREQDALAFCTRNAPLSKVRRLGLDPDGEGPADVAALTAGNDTVSRLVRLPYTGVDGQPHAFTLDLVLKRGGAWTPVEVWSMAGGDAHDSPPQRAQRAAKYEAAFAHFEALRLVDPGMAAFEVWYMDTPHHKADNRRADFQITRLWRFTTYDSFRAWSASPAGGRGGEGEAQAKERLQELLRQQVAVM